MHWILEKLETTFDKLIVPALLVLLVIVIADIFFTDFKYQYENYFFYADVIVLGIFAGDLSFKLHRATNWEGFLKNEWLEILAVIPFFWIFRLVENVVRLGELAQEVLHLVARGGRFARLFAAVNVAVPRHQRFANFLEKITKTDRFERAAHFYKHPKEDLGLEKESE